MASLTPHGPGFSFIDSVEVIAPSRLRATKWLDPQLPFFADHFPGEPLMPGVLLIESAAQAAGALWGTLGNTAVQERFALAQVLQFKLRQPALPGATLVIEVELEKDFGSLAQFAAEIKVDDSVVAAGKIVLAKPGA